MISKKSIKLFENKKIRVVWDEDKEEWYFSIVDVIKTLTRSVDSNAYWRKLKQRLKEEGNQTVTNCHTLKMRSLDGKMRLTDTGTTEQILRLIQSIPSKKVEPFKIWLAKVGNERINEMYAPELAIERAMNTYLQKGYSESWIEKRVRGIIIRDELTDEWKERSVNTNKEYSILTLEISK